MKVEIECPVCNFRQQAETFITGECQKCYNSYYWEEDFTGDFSDSWTYVMWDEYPTKETQ